MNHIPDGDVLIHAGDLTNHGELDQVESFNEWLGDLPHSHKLVIAGNHDFCFESQPSLCKKLLSNCTYLMDSECVIDGINFYGSPWQPWFYDWAFNLHRGPEIHAKWKQIPLNTDVLITHGPPKGFGDQTAQGDLAGCEDLLKEILKRNIRLHVSGHIHEGYGTTTNKDTPFVNASICTLKYKPTNPPVVIDL